VTVANAILNILLISISGIFWHPQTHSVVLKGSRRRIQFFDPIQLQQKLCLEASNQDEILGDRDFDSKSLSVLSLFSLSPCGNWLATIEANWDTMNGNCLKIWHFSTLVLNIYFYSA